MEVVDSSSFNNTQVKTRLGFLTKKASLFSNTSYSLKDLSSNLSLHFNLRQEPSSVNHKRRLNEEERFPKDLKALADGFKKVKTSVHHDKGSLSISIEDNNNATTSVNQVPWKTKIEKDIWKIDPVICQKYLQIELYKPISPKKDLVLKNMEEEHEKLKAKLWEKFNGNKVTFLPISIENQQLAKALEQAIQEASLMSDKDNGSENSIIEESSTSLSSVCLFASIKKDQEKDRTIETRVGKHHQTSIMPFNLNHSRKVKKRCVKKVWEPENIITQENWEKYCEKISKIIGEEVTKEDALIRHLVKSNGDWEKAVKEVEKFKIYYKSVFGVGQISLRNRNFCLKPQSTLRHAYSK